MEKGKRDLGRLACIKGGFVKQCEFTFSLDVSGT